MICYCGWYYDVKIVMTGIITLDSTDFKSFTSCLTTKFTFRPNVRFIPTVPTVSKRHEIKSLHFIQGLKVTLITYNLMVNLCSAAKFLMYRILECEYCYFSWDLRFLKAVRMKIILFLVSVPCRLVGKYQHFPETVSIFRAEVAIIISGEIYMGQGKGDEYWAKQTLTVTDKTN